MMKRIIKIVFSVVCVLALLFADSVYAKKKARKKKGIRAAATSLGGGSSSSSSSKKSSGGKKLKSSKKKSNSKKKKSSSSSDDVVEEDAEIKKKIASIPEAKCLNDNLQQLLKGDCSFLNEEDVLKGMNQPLLCVYSYKSGSKIKSVTDYFVSNKYGVSEGSVKKDASVTVEDEPKRTSAYYKYILDGLNDKSLKEAKILDFITTEVLDQSSGLDDNTYSAISKKVVDSTKIVIDVLSTNLEACKKASKKIVQTCGALTSSEAQELIDDSCIEYETSLTKQTAKLKNEVFDRAPEILEVLKQRASSK